MELALPSPIQQLKSDFLASHEIDLWLKRDDLIHPEISGNKWRKLKFNLEKAKARNTETILTFGGAYSNHIAATAAACKQANLRSIGIIRGERIEPLNPTLQQATSYGMNLHFVSREEYREKEKDWYIQELRLRFGSFHLVPEGGANYYGVMGCMEILKEIKQHFDLICAAGGTGTTLAGLLMSIRSEQQVLGFPALKGGEFLRDNMKHLLKYSLYDEEFVESQLEKLQLKTEYHFGGYGKVKQELVDFVNEFYDTYEIPLDLIYTGKMMFGLFDMIKTGLIAPKTKLLVIHTGGIQGNQGMKERLGVQLNF